MAAPTRTCPSCETPLPVEAGYCPSCGEATPTEISGETGTVRAPETTDTDEQEYRGRLQRALGDGYELRDLIGRGGFGAVYAAWDVKLEREVAIKALRHDLFLTSALLERFEREAKAVAKLRHPNVLPIYSVGEGDGINYMVMPKIEGESLRAMLLREGQLSADEATRIASECANALQAAHDAGIIHRDVKPENILLEGDERQVLLMDFGIAKAVEGAGTDLTGTGSSIGTPLYMSPEQAAGERRIDHRSDIYSLGCVLYEMLAGEPPFTGPNAQAIIARHISEVVPSLQIVRPGLPDGIYGALSKTLAKVPADRFGSAEQLWKTLDRIATLAPTSDVPTNRSYRKRFAALTTVRWLADSQKVRLAVRVVVVLLLGVTASVIVTQPGRVLPPEDRDLQLRCDAAKRIVDEQLVYLRQGLYSAARTRMCDAAVACGDMSAPAQCQIFRFVTALKRSALIDSLASGFNDLGLEIQRLDFWPNSFTGWSGTAITPDSASSVRFVLVEDRSYVYIAGSTTTYRAGVFASKQTDRNAFLQVLRSGKLALDGGYSYTTTTVDLGFIVNVADPPADSVTISMHSASLREVLDRFVGGSVLAFILDVDVDENMPVVAHFTGEEWATALGELLATYGLRALEEVEGSGIIKILKAGSDEIP